MNLKNRDAPIFRKKVCVPFFLIALAACGQKPPAAPTAADADAFVAGINEELRAKLPLLNASSWLQSTFITDDVGSSRVDLQACKLEYSIVSPK